MLEQMVMSKKTGMNVDCTFARIACRRLPFEDVE
jgi:hypothetical protein